MITDASLVPVAARPVVVGVDGSRAALAAVEWAAQEARLRRVPLRLVYVVSPVVSTRAGEQVLVDAVAAALAVEPDVDPDVVVVAGEVSRVLIGQTAAAGVLALGVDPLRRRSQHGVLGPLEERVAAHAACPTVWVSPRSTPADQPEVLVIVPGDPVVVGALHWAAAEAELRAASLAIVVDPRRRTCSTEEMLDRAVLEIGRAHPTLPVVVEDHPLLDGETLVSLITHPARCHRLELVVLSGPHAEDTWSLRTGELGPALAHNGVVPVMYVGAPDASRHVATDSGAVPSREPSLS